MIKMVGAPQSNALTCPDTNYMKVKHLNSGSDNIIFIWLH
ncbi:hypothetical protein FHS70_005201 [Flammeovirga yaeyamensis]|nr:hypothetical protein [Flammeovirga yaeyamensis]